MKIAVAAEEGRPDANVASRFGRAPAFVLIDSETGEFEAAGNEEGVTAGHGAGTAAAELLVKRGAECVIAQRYGPKAFAALSAAKLPLYLVSDGTVGDAVAALGRGDLSAATGPNS